MKHIKRTCMDCGAAITGCMGFVHAGDWLRAVNGGLEAGRVRERCGRCVELAAREQRHERPARPGHQAINMGL